MKGLFVAGLVGAPLVAIILFFALQGKEEIRQEQSVDKIEQKIESVKFDQEFAKAWNSSGEMKAPSDKELDALEAERDRLVAKKDRTDKSSDADMADLREALKEIGGKK